jgi:photosystem II stability/assembly factor-like uncharacterized protein
MTWRNRVLVGCLAVALLAGCGSSVRPRSTPTSTSPTSATPTASPAPDPSGVSFWDAQEGLLVATVTTPACLSGSAVCPGGVIERTTDGGRTWQVVDRIDAPLDAVATAGGGVAWVTAARCSPGSPDACRSDRLLETSDGGITWEQVIPVTAVTSIAPVSATTAWAVAGARGAAFPTGTTTLVYTTDAGRLWQAKPDPCPSASGLGLWAVGFDGPLAGWATCAGQPATDMQAKALLRTLNGGSTWTLEARTCFPLEPAANVGTMSCVGYLPGTQLLADGHGWQWTYRYGIAATSDGGSSWAPIASSVVSDDINDVLSASLVNDTTGFVLIDHPKACPANGCGPELLSTINSGHSWTELSYWNS